MTQFKEINGQLFELTEPRPLTAFDKTLDGVLLREKYPEPQLIVVHENPYCKPTQMRAIIRYEIIGIPVPEGSAKWAWYQMQCGKKVYRPAESDVKNWHYSMDIPNIASLHGIPGISCERNYGGWMNLMANTGWKLYEPEPQVRVGDWVTDGVVQGRMVTRTADTTWVEDWDGKQYHIETSRLRKLDPSEVKVTIMLTGTVSKDSILDRAGCFTLKTTGDEYIVGLFEIDNQEQVESLLKAQEEGK